MTQILNEVKRSQSLQKSKGGDKYVWWNRLLGDNRHERRLHQKVSRSVANYNKLNMNKLFKEDILDVNIEVRGETDTYTVRMSFLGFLDNFKKVNTAEDSSTVKLRDITRALTMSFNQEDVYFRCNCPDWCLHPSTEIKLLNNEVYTVADLMTKYQAGEELWVYSTDEQGDFKPGKVTDVWISGYTSELIEVTLDNGRSIVTTPNHRYMLRDGSYLEAEKLEIGQSLMPLYSKIVSVERIESAEAIPVYDISVETYNNFYVDAGVVLHNCYRQGYWATKNGTIVGEPETRPSDITNPHDTKGGMCKHVAMVMSNNSWLQKVASVIRNYILYMQKHMPDLYYKVMYPALYGREYDEVQMDLDDITGNERELGSEESDIDVSNKWAKTKSQFKPGNEYRYRPVSKDDDEIEGQKRFDFDSEISD